MISLPDGSGRSMFFRNLLWGVAVYTTVALGVAVSVLCLIPVSLAAAVCNAIRTGSPTPMDVSRTALLRQLNDVVQESELASEWIQVPDPLDARVLDVHLITRRVPDPEAEAVLLVHGTDSQALVFADILRDLPRDRSYFAVDLPGYGISTASPLASTDLGPGERLQWYADVLVRVISQLQLRRVTIVGHSYGATIATILANKNPDAVTKVVLVCPAGLLPTLGDWGMYWALLFKSRLPRQLLMWPWTRALCLPLLPWVAQGNRVLALWLTFLFQVHPDCTSPVNTASCIQYEGFTAVWNTPILPCLANGRAQVSLIFAESDTIIPMHQLPVILKYAESPVKGYIVPGAGHTMSRAFVPVIQTALNEQSARYRVSKVRLTALRKILQFQQYCVCFDPQETRNEYEWLYSRLNAS